MKKDGKVTAGQLKKFLKNIPDDKEIVISGFVRDGRECGNLFSILGFDKKSWDNIGGIIRTDVIIDFDALCGDDPVKVNLKRLKELVDKLFEEALKS